MKEATLTSAHVAESFQSVIDWKALKSNVALIGRKLLTLAKSEITARTVCVTSSIVGFYATLWSDTLFIVSVIVATVALMRLLIPMAKGGEK